MASVVASRAAASRSFAVEAFVGRKATGWPFARLDVATSELCVRLPFPWFISRRQAATAIDAVILSSRFGRLCCIRFDDGAGSLANVHVHPLLRTQLVIEELRRCGYRLRDERSAS